MSKKIDVIGKKFNRFLVLDEDERDKNGDIRVKCLCDCGNIKTVRWTDLKSEKIKSCGCLLREKRAENGRKNKADITGKTFGMLEAIRYLYTNTNRRAVWEFKCACGNLTKASVSDVRRGDVTSCGCLRESYIATAVKSYCVENHSAIPEYEEVKNPQTGCYLPYDIVIFLGEFTIYCEISGSQHFSYNPFFQDTYQDFEKQQERDRIKRQWAEKHGTFIEIDLRDVRTVEDALNIVEEEVIETECCRLCL